MRLIIQAILGIVFLMLVMAVALFVPAGSLSYWQAWAYLAVFAGCTILITAYLAAYDKELLAGRVQAGPAAETRPAQRVIQSLASLFFIALFVVPGLDFRFGWSTVPAMLCVLADVLVALGFLIVFLTFRENTYTRGTIEVSGAQHLVTTGPYGVVRHPMYAGALLLLAATPVALKSWVALPLAVALALVIVARIKDEEALLSRDLEGYEGYRKTVRHRLVPFVW
jgi:protein-S-isoprenylcysteine O-methyltransferase Ste14